MIKKNIVIEEDTWEKLKILSSIETGNSISQIIREAVNNLLKQRENDLAFQLRLNTALVDEAEQAEIEAEILSLTDEDLKVTKVIEL